MTSNIMFISFGQYNVQLVNITSSGEPIKVVVICGRISQGPSECFCIECQQERKESVFILAHLSVLDSFPRLSCFQEF